MITSAEGTYVDCTLGGGGHAELLLRDNPGINVVGIDRDGEAVAYASERLKQFGGRIRIIKANFGDIAKALAEAGIGKVSGFLLDLGISSWQVDNRARGFSFASENLDMRMDASAGPTAEEIINTAGREKLSEIFSKYGEERMADAVASRIVEERKISPIISGRQLSVVVGKAIRRHGKTNPATKVFQALRIAVNGELDNLSAFLKDFPVLLNSGGRIAVLTYHSLEDRIVKQGFKELDDNGVIRILNKKVLRPEFAETRQNPRSRSAKLRTAERV